MFTAPHLPGWSASFFLRKSGQEQPFPIVQGHGTAVNETDRDFCPGYAKEAGKFAHETVLFFVAFLKVATVYDKVLHIN